MPADRSWSDADRELEAVLARYRDRADWWSREAKIEDERSTRENDRHAQAARHCRAERDDWHALADLLYVVAYPRHMLDDIHLAAAAERLAHRLDPQWTETKQVHHAE